MKAGLIQTALACDVSESLETIRNAQIERTLKYIDQAGQEGVQMLCMQEIFTGPYFCAEQSTRWYDSVEKIPDGPTTKLMQEYAKKYAERRGVKLESIPRIKGWGHHTSRFNIDEDDAYPALVGPKLAEEGLEVAAAACRRLFELFEV